MQDQDITVAQLIAVAFEEYCLIIHPHKKCRFTGSTEKIHRTMHEIAQKYSHIFPLLNDLHFATAGAFPHSSELYTALWILEESGILVSFYGTNDDCWIERSMWPDSQEFLDRWKQKAFTNNKKELLAFQNFARELGDNLLLQ